MANEVGCCNHSQATTASLTLTLIKNLYTMMKFNFQRCQYGFDLECYMDHEGKTYERLGIYRIETKCLKFGRWWCTDPFPFYIYESFTSRDCKKRIYDANM